MSVVPRCTKNFPVSKFSFSIDHILNVAGKKENFENLPKSEHKNFEWLSCTRYRPPKLPRQKKKEKVQRRKAGRNPRIPFSSSQVAFLEAKFLRTPYLNSSDVAYLSSCLKLTETRVKIWFQNRRAREKRDQELKNQRTTGDSKAKDKAERGENRGNEESPELYSLRHGGLSRTYAGFREGPLDLSERRCPDQLSSH